MTDQPYNHLKPDWGPLERAVQAAGLPLDECLDWMWMAEFRQGEHSYKHRDTRGYAVLTADMPLDQAVARVRVARDDGAFGGSK